MQAFGGDGGQAGNVINNPDPLTFPQATGSAGTNGGRGFAVTGNSLVTQSGWTGTIDGSTTG